MVAGIIVTTDLRTVELATLDYASLSEAVGGYIQIVHLRGRFDGFAMYVNEEGKLNGLPMNDLATVVWEKSFGAFTDVIVGGAVIVNTKTDDEGNELPLTDEQTEYLMKELQSCFANL
jgi:hypothetical protein